MANTYDIGDKVKITGYFTTGGVASDPVTVRVIVKNPAGVSTTYTYPNAFITKEAVGRYSFQVLGNAAGNWYYRMDDGIANVATESFFRIRLSNTV